MAKNKEPELSREEQVEILKAQLELAHDMHLRESDHTLLVQWLIDNVTSIVSKIQAEEQTP